MSADEKAAAPLFSRELQFACQGCGRCCAGPGGHVFVEEDEAQALAGCLGLAPGDFLTRFTRRHEGRIALIDAPGGDCVFLRGNRCAVYRARPWQCRAWPFWFRNVRSDEAWRLTARSCPGVGRGRRHTPLEIQAWLDGRPTSKRSQR